MWRVVIHSDDDKRLRGRKKFSRIRALCRIARHVIHFAVVAAREPLFEKSPFICEFYCAHDANLVEPEIKRSSFDCLGAFDGA